MFVYETDEILMGFFGRVKLRQDYNFSMSGILSIWDSVSCASYNWSCRVSCKYAQAEKIRSQQSRNRWVFLFPSKLCNTDFPSLSVARVFQVSWTWQFLILLKFGETFQLGNQNDFLNHKTFSKSQRVLSIDLNKVVEIWFSQSLHKQPQYSR